MTNQVVECALKVPQSSIHDLKTTLQVEFDLLKTATLKNIQNIHEVVQSQQAYM